MVILKEIQNWDIIGKLYLPDTFQVTLGDFVCCPTNWLGIPSAQTTNGEKPKF